MVFLDDVYVTNQDVYEFQRILETIREKNRGSDVQYSALDYWFEAVAPKIIEMDDVKRAVLCALASHWDSPYSDRWRIHILCYGKYSSGTGKTPILRFMRNLGGGYVSAQRATKAGLTVNLHEGVAGFLPRHHRNCAGIDEIDKFSAEDRNSLLEVLEDGMVTFASAKYSGSVPAEAIIIAGANDISWLTPEQFLRFDFRFKIDPYTVREAQNIADDISMYMGKPKSRDTEKLKKYLRWIRSREASISDEVRSQGANIIKNYIEYSKNTNIRHVQSIWRVARSLARLNYSNVTVEDVKRAIKMLSNNETVDEVL